MPTPKPKHDIGDRVRVPHPEKRIFGEIRMVKRTSTEVHYLVEWWDGGMKHASTFPEHRLDLMESD